MVEGGLRVVYLNPGVREMERLFEVLQVDVAKYVEKGFDVKEMWSKWKEVRAAVEKGIGRNKVTERSEGQWSEDVERLIVIRKMTCRKLGKHGREECVRLH